MSKTTYWFQIHDFYTEPDKCRIIELDEDYPTEDSAKAAGWVEKLSEFAPRLTR